MTTNDRRHWVRCHPEQLATLRFNVKEFGFACLEHALDSELLGRLQAEATAQLDPTITAAAEGGSETGYHARIGTLGAVAKSLLKSHETATFLQAVFGEAMVLTEDASCFTYYQDGDYLGLHRDRPSACFVTMIVYLDAVSPDPEAANTGLILHVYGKECPAADPPRLLIPTIAGALVVGRGSESWHRRPRLQTGEHVAALTACFAAAVSATG